MKTPATASSDDYAVLSCDGTEFYYGYEEREDDEWCFTAKIPGKEKIKVPFSKLKAKDMFQCQECLLIGIGWVINRYGFNL